jgi:Sec7-like guanine-nucleotide exchange factor
MTSSTTINPNASTTLYTLFHTSQVSKRITSFLEGTDADRWNTLVQKKTAPQKMQQRNIGIQYFNHKPQHGLKYLIDSGSISNDTRDIAQFLLNNESLDRDKVGELLSSCDELSCKLREAFVDLQRETFTGTEFEVALRQFLSTFGLPKEAQQIDRMLQIFGTKYYCENKNTCSTIFKDADAAYIFTYAVIMLNTELHSPALSYRKRMSMKQFIKNNSGCGYEYPIEFQEKIYNSIKDEEILFKEDNNKKNNKNTCKKKKKNKYKPSPLFKSMKQSVFRVALVVSLSRSLL